MKQDEGWIEAKKSMPPVGMPVLTIVELKYGGWGMPYRAIAIGQYLKAGWELTNTETGEPIKAPNVISWQPY